MIRHWFTRADAPLTTGFVKRFDPRHFTVDFPRGAIASAVLGPQTNSLRVTAEFVRRNDLVGLIYESDDHRAHPVNQRELNRDYRRCRLKFRWKSQGLPGLDGVNGATLTIEGRDRTGAPRTWYVRLWNYASGTPADAVIQLNFDDLRGGFNLDTGADPVEAQAIDRMFFSLVPEEYADGDHSSFDRVREAVLEITELACEGSGSVLRVNDAMVPEHALRMCTGYDDLYNLVPERVIESVERLGYRKLINHYIGMSHHQRLTGSGLVDPGKPLNSAAVAWHSAFANAARNAGFDVIFSLSFEITASACPQHWKQRTFDDEEALTAYDPPSSLISPANEEAVEYLSRTAVALAEIADNAGLTPRIQIGEAWWWVTTDNRPCLYDEATQAALGTQVVRIDDVRAAEGNLQLDFLDQVGRLLSTATAKITAAVRRFRADAQLLLLVYTPTIFAPDRPEWHRANLPAGWSFPAFDILQLEDYEWLTADMTTRSQAAGTFVDGRLGYPKSKQHHFVGFAAEGTMKRDWQRITSGAQRALESGAAEVMVWALPQILRDRVTIFDDGEECMDAFADVLFPIEIGAEASVIPGFSTTVLTSASGHEFRNANWSQARLRFDAGPGVRGDEELNELITFFRARRGSAQAFRFRDPYDFSSRKMNHEPTMLDELIGVGDGETTTFLLSKSYAGGEVRRITRPVPASVKIALNGVEQQLNWKTESLGSIVFEQPPEAGTRITAGFLFDVPVRFATDQIEITRATFLAGEAPSVPLVEIREEVS
ncbi:DUF2460 domain-containing protein [Sphingomonas sp. KRR8]|uniref:DUF2460 domain-containing protein n=1 Tax=Sphingomonas sp. KRR8 TaxID=2942996 RepID=UPI002021C13D|nr:DUF2460 domain-containing protein [Sphingomonas sp. KRR8]URD62207.1 DUF2460 domain-containing protein [Sphingomonas sp. KRR8]